MARLYKYIKSTLLGILETNEKTKLQSLNFPLIDNKNINYYTLRLGKVEFFTSPSYFIFIFHRFEFQNCFYE